MFDDYGAVVYVRKGKTGARRVRVINAAPLLANWMENHPLRQADAPLWVDMSTNTKFEQLKWIGLSRLIRRWGKEARIEKPFTAYIFRHTRLTHLSKFMTEAQLCMFAGWTIGSKMPRMYVHLSGRDMDDTLLKAYGLKKSEELEAPKVPKKCVRCGAVCNAEAETCSKCGMAMTLTAALRKDEEMENLKRQVGVLLDYMAAQKGGPKVLRNLKESDLV
jgi:ribosomal protein L37E